MFKISEMARFSLLIFFFVFRSICVFASTPEKIDSLKNRLNRCGEESKKTSLLNQLSDVYTDIQLDSALNYASRALELAVKNSDDFGKANANNKLGNIFLKQGNLEFALKHFFDALACCEKFENKEMLGGLHNNIGIVYQTQKNYQRALEYYLKSLQYFDSETNPLVLANTNNNIGLVYSFVQKYDKAIEYFNNSLSLRIRANNAQGIAISHANIAFAQKGKKNYKQALKSYEKALKMSQKYGFKQIQTIVNCNLGDLYAEKNDMQKATIYYKKALQLSEKIALLEWLKKSSKGLADVYERSGKMTQAFHYYKKYKNIEDSVFGIESRKQFQHLEARYENAKKEKELAQSKEENLRLLQKNEIYEIKLRSTIQLSIVLSFLLIAILLLVVIYFRLNKFKSRLNKKLERKVKERTLELEASNQRLINEIEEKNRVEKRLQIARKQAEESDRLKSAFLANISHEVRTPMNVILGFSELLEKECKLTSELASYTKTIKDGTRQLLNIINDIVDISKLDSGSLKLKETEFDLNELLDDMYKVFTADNEVFDSKGIHVFVSKGLQNDEAIIITDKLRLRQVLTNLVNNGLKFTKQGYVEFGYLLRNDQMLEFYVKDTGIGITQEKQKEIFNRFIQLENSNTRNYGGTGIGLSISKELIELLGGNIWVNSQSGKGSTFRFTLPFKQRGQKDISEKKQSLFNWSAFTIMLVQEKENKNRHLKTILEPTQAKLIYASDAPKALDKLHTNPNINAIIIDADMNGISLFKTVDLLKQIKILPVFALTNLTQENETDAFTLAGFDDIIAAPLEGDHVLKKINNSLISCPLPPISKNNDLNLLS